MKNKRLEYDSKDTFFKNGENIESCWGLDGFGINVVEKKEEWEHRLNILKNTIDFWINPKNISDKTIKIIHLFFDGFDSSFSINF